jgi:hypothetical protein
VFVGTRFLVVVSLFGAIACGDPPAGSTALGEAKVELGTGEAEFEAIDGEPTLDMAAGSQGGFHVWMSLVAHGYDEERLEATIVTTVIGDDDEEEEPLTMRPRLPGELIQRDDAQSEWRFAGYPAQVRDARCAHGKRVRLEVKIWDSNDREASDERHCVVALHEDYRSNCD